MNDAERELINGLFERMKKFEAIEKDRDVANLVRSHVDLNPDAPYLLAQSVLVQEQALQRAETRIRELQQALHASQVVPTQSHALSRPDTPDMGRQSASSVPVVGQGRRSVADGPSAGGGFMAQALSTAAGVAGGMLLASAISNLLSSDAGSSADAASAASQGGAATPVADESVTSGNPLTSNNPSDAVTPTNFADEQEHSAGDNGWGDWGDFGSDIDL
ncbi:MAG: DUF2076 domain-containing protein [Hyphomicrobiaceae bacterium]